MSNPDELFMAVASPMRPSDPYPMLAEMRAIAPVYDGPGGMAYLSRYEDCAALHRSPAAGVLPRQEDPRYAESITFQSLAAGPLAHDPPEHTRIRALVSKGFAARSVEVIRPFVRDLVTERLDDLAGASSVEIMSAVASRIPAATISQLIGIPGQAHDLFGDLVARWSAILGPGLMMGLDSEELAEVDGLSQQMLSIVAEVLESRRSGPVADDFLSALVASGDCQGVGADQIVRLALFLYGAGFDTTAWAIGDALHTLGTHPEQRAALARGEIDIRNAVEELLRFDGPTFFGIPRLLHDELELSTKTVPAGTPVFALVAAGHRDPRHYEQPDKLDLERENIVHLTFGAGPHFCLGAPLARIEIQEAIGAFVHRYPDYEVEDIDWLPYPHVRGPARLTLSLK